MFNIALLSPNQNAYSETFIQRHKDLLKGNVFYYYSGELPRQVENGLLLNSRRARIIDIIMGHFRLNKFSLEEKALIKSFRQNRIDIVFAEFGGTGQAILPVCRELNLPLVVHFHGYDVSRKAEIKRNKKYREVFDYAEILFVVSRKMGQDLKVLGCPDEKIRYTVYGPNEKFLQIQPEFSKQQFISIGRFVNKKAPYYLILSFRKVLEKFPKAKLVMAGDGELLNTCKNLVNFYHLQDQVEFIGVITPEKFRCYLKDSTAFVQHSITADDGDSEGTPVSILEAAAAGLPVISTYHAGIPDVVINEQTGLLVEEHDVIGMAEKMMELLQNPNLALELGKNGKKRIRDEFSLEKHINVLNCSIEEILRKS